MIAALDVAYGTDRAAAAAVLFRDWTDDAPTAEHTAIGPIAAEYRSGELWRRELPHLLAVLERAGPLDLVVVDAHVWLATGKAGLGAHLWRALEEKVPVVGVAKEAFAGNDAAIAVLRGTSRRALFVSAAGTDAAEAAERVRAMHGAHRLPTLLQRVDALSRDALREGS